MSVRVGIQPESQDKLSGQQHQRKNEKGSEPEFFHEYAAAKKSQCLCSGPNDVVDADRTRQTLYVFAFADERFNRRPQEALADRQHDGGQNQADCGIELRQLRACRQPKKHEAQPELQRLEIAAPLREPPGLPGGKNIHETV